MKAFYRFCVSAILQHAHHIPVISQRLHRLIEPLEIFEAGLSLVGCDFLGEFRQCIESGPSTLYQNEESLSQENAISEII